MASSRYIDYPIPVDAQDFIQRAFAYLKAKNPNWEPSEGQLDTWILEATASEAADVGTLTSKVPKSIFKYFGSQLFGIIPINETSATAHAHFFLSDSLGHTIPAGTQVGILDSAGNLIPFTTVTDTVVAGGISDVDNVLIVAAVGGSSGTGLGSIGGTIQLIDPISWISSITQDDVTSGGVDAETDDEYLNRLTLELQTMSPRPILPRDFSILARNVAGVQRATTIDGYNPAGGGTFGNERMVTVVSLDSLGAGVSGTVKTAIQTYLDAMREINFVVNTTDPTVNQVDVNVHINVRADYSLTDVQSRVYSAVTNYLDPRYWGIGVNDNPNDPQTWNNITTVYYLELAALINDIPGVDRITLLELGIHLAALAASDLALTGVAPIPNPNTITVVGVYA